jgi:hypothetical protein
MNPFAVYTAVALVATTAWTILDATTTKEARRPWGLAGAWVSTLVLTALWHSHSIPWLWVSPQAVLLAWVGALVLMIYAATAKRRDQRPPRTATIACAWLGFAVGTFAGLHLLWIATVSAGGV